jgi:hypothetical protein
MKLTISEYFRTTMILLYIFGKWKGYLSYNKSYSTKEKTNITGILPFQHLKL